MPILGWAMLFAFAVIVTLLIIKRDKEIKRTANISSSKDEVRV